MVSADEAGVHSRSERADGFADLLVSSEFELAETRGGLAALIQPRHSA